MDPRWLKDKVDSGPDVDLRCHRWPGHDLSSLTDGGHYGLLTGVRVGWLLGLVDEDHSGPRDHHTPSHVVPQTLVAADPVELVDDDAGLAGPLCVIHRRLLGRQSCHPDHRVPNRPLGEDKHPAPMWSSPHPPP